MIHVTNTDTHRRADGPCIRGLYSGNDVDGKLMSSLCRHRLSWNSTTPTPTPTSFRKDFRKDVSVPGESAIMLVSVSASWNASFSGRGVRSFVQLIAPPLNRPTHAEIVNGRSACRPLKVRASVRRRLCKVAEYNHLIHRSVAPDPLQTRRHSDEAVYAVRRQYRVTNYRMPGASVGATKDSLSFVYGRRSPITIATVLR